MPMGKLENVSLTVSRKNRKIDTVEALKGVE